MQQQLPKYYFSRLLRAILEFNLIQDGDRVLIGLSGGKDSVFLTYALAQFRKHAPINFDLAVLTIDPMFTTDFDTAPLADFCASLDVPFHTFPVNIAKAIAANGEKDPCFTCAFFRRGAMNNFAAEHGFNKLALAHHYDDAVETFLMSLVYSGQLTTFQPKTYLDRSGITVIRPLVYFREQDLRTSVSLHGFTPLPSPCPRDGKTKRQEIKELIANLSQTNSALFTHLSAAMRQGVKLDLWPQEPSREVMKEKHNAFWHKKPLSFLCKHY